MSITLGDALVYLGADKTGLKKDLDQAQQETKSWVSALGHTIAQGIGQGIGQGLTNVAMQALNAVKRTASEGVRTLTQGMVGGNAQFEQYNEQFAVLLKSAPAAKQRMAELAEFGRVTPFDLPGVVQADLILQGFGLHAENVAQRFGFSGEEIRRIAGDVASGTKASFDEMAGYLGKFSSGATGEAIARFQEMGVVTRAELAGLGLEFSKSGELLSPMDEAMTVLLAHMDEKYGGMMDVQSRTFNGMLSNLDDWKGNTLRIIGEPTFELLKEQLQGLLTFLDSPGVERSVLGLRDLFFVATHGALAIMRGFGAAGKAFFKAIFGDFDTASTNLANNTGSWGRNVVLQFARGMAASATAVVTVLNDIGKVIAHWLSPGSPPRLLPDIDKWGTAAMQEFMDGMSAASVGGLKSMGGKIMDTLSGVQEAGLVGLFSTISNTVQRLMQSTAVEDDQGLIGRIIGSRAVIGQAIQDIQEYGRVTDSTLSAIQQALVNLPPAANDYVQAMIRLYQANQDVTRAQEELNRVTQEYDDKLNPLQKELDALRTQEANVADEKRIASLRQAIARGALNEEQKAQALREIRARELALQIRGLEEEKETAVDAAKEKLDAAEAEQKAAEKAAALQQSLIDAQLESNNLIQQQISLLDRLANAMTAVGEGIADSLKEKLGKGDGLTDVLNDALGDVDLDIDTEGLTSLFDDLDIAGLVAEITAEFAPLEEQMGNLGTTLGDLRTAWDGFLQRFGLLDEEGQPTIDWLGTLGDVLLIVGGAVLGVKIGSLVMGLLGLVGAAGSASGVMATFGTIVTALGGPVVWLMAIIGALAAAWHTDFMGMRTTLTGLWELFMIILDLLWQRVVQWDKEVGDKFYEWRETVRTNAEMVGKILDALEARLWLKANAMKTTLLQLQQKAKDEFAKIGRWFEEAKTAVSDLRDKFNEQIQKIMDKVGQAKDFVFGLWDALKGFWEWIKGKVFEFKINLPSLPDWAVPGSPIPLHTAWKNFAEDMNAMTIKPDFDLPEYSSVGAPTPAAVSSAPTIIQFLGNIILGDQSAAEYFVSYLEGLSEADALAGVSQAFAG